MCFLGSLGVCFLWLVLHCNECSEAAWSIMC
jgi:hypothetical protein